MVLMDGIIELIARGVGGAVVVSYFWLHFWLGFAAGLQNCRLFKKIIRFAFYLQLLHKKAFRFFRIRQRPLNVDGRVGQEG